MSAEDIYWRIKEAARVAIADLNLELLDAKPERVHNCLFPDETLVPFPNIQLTTEGEQEQQLGGDSDSEEWLYPVRCWIADVAGHRDHPRARLYLTARRAIIWRFNRKDKTALGLVDVPEVQECEVRPGIVFSPELPQYSHVVTGLVLAFHTFESRE